MIEKIKALCVKHREILVYLIVGGLTTLVSWAAKFLWNAIFYANTVSPTVAQNTVLSIVENVSGIAFAYPTNRRWVFQSRNPHILSEMGTFGDLLWVGLKGNQGLSAVVRDVRGALDAAGIDYDKKKFVPHITIIRKMNGNWKSVPAPKGEMMVKKISLMKSEVKDGKRVYTEI